MKNKAQLEDVAAAPVIAPDVVTKMRKEEMKQAIFQRFGRERDADARIATPVRKRSPYWQPVDEEC